MRSCSFITLFSCFSLISFSQNYNATSNTLGGCGLKKDNVWSNFTNQAGLAEINQLIIGAGTENSFGLKELSTKSTALALPVNGGVFGLNITYTRFEIYNKTKIRLVFGKKLSKIFNVGIQIDYLVMYADKSTNKSNKFTFEIGAQRRLMQELTLVAHIFDPIAVKLNEDENIPAIFG